MISDEDIKREFLAAGFTVKPGNDDLKPYVYEAARRVLALAATHLEAEVARSAAAERERVSAPTPCALTWAIQRLNSTPYAMTKDECVEMLRGLRSEIQALVGPNAGLHRTETARAPQQEG